MNGRALRKWLRSVLRRGCRVLLLQLLVEKVGQWELLPFLLRRVLQDVCRLLGFLQINLHPSSMERTCSHEPRNEFTQGLLYL